MWDMWFLDRRVKSDAERVRWQFAPFEAVGPLRFGMTHDEVVASLGGAPSRVLGSPGSPGRHLIFFSAGVNAYFDETFGLACVAVDACDGPQVLAPDGFALVGRVPSQARLWVVNQVEAMDTSWIANEYFDVALEEIGLVLRVQRTGDISLTRPVFVARVWFDEANSYPHTPGGSIPEYEFRYGGLDGARRTGPVAPDDLNRGS